ncbi:MAG: rRNA pseudouridine synthase [Bryobacteraceae bacterium]|nr:rRNA pseudouridine synthase [Bryobacteraceae bacterium]
MASRRGAGKQARRRPDTTPDTPLQEGPQRLQKILAHAGIASRRKAEVYILGGRVTINGATVSELGVKADPSRDHIKVDGKLLRQPRDHIYLALNKPRECVTTVSDPKGRRTVMHLVSSLRRRVYPVGRLDYNSEGLLLMTDDGEFAARIMSPASRVPKTYQVKVNGTLTVEQEERFRGGIPLHGRRTAPAELKLIRPGRNPWYEVTITEGRRHQVRNMFKSLGRLVEKLKRVRIGFVNLGDLAPGDYRLLTPAEVARFRKLSGMDRKKKDAPNESGDR